MKKIYARTLSIFLGLVLLFSNMGMENIVHAAAGIENIEWQTNTFSEIGSDYTEDIGETDSDHAEDVGENNSGNVENVEESDLDHVDDADKDDSENADTDESEERNPGNDIEDTNSSDDNDVEEDAASGNEEFVENILGEEIEKTEEDVGKNLEGNTDPELDFYALDRWNSNTVFNEEIEDKVAEQIENGGYDIYSIEVSGKIATISFKSVSEAVLVVSIYDEDTRQMLASGSVEISEDMETAQVEIDIDTMPDYFYMKGFIVDSYALNPLCTAFDSNLYTKSIQEFLAKSADDFIAENRNVIKFDEEGENYLVMADDIAYIVCDSEAEEETEPAEEKTVLSRTAFPMPLQKNELISFDEDTKTFVFANPDLLFLSSVNKKRKFVYNYKDEYTLAISPKTVTNNADGTITIVAEDDQNISDFFDYVKIEEEDKEFSEMEEPEASDVEIASEGSSEGGKLSYKLSSRKNKDDPEAFGADLKLSLSASFSCKYIYTPEERYFESKISITFDINGSVSLKKEKDIPIVTLIFPIGPSKVEVPLTLHLEGEVSADIDFELTGEYGASQHYDGWRPIKKVETNLKTGFEGEVKIGFQLEASIIILSKLLADAKLTAFAGAVIKENVTMENVSDDSYIHDCKPEDKPDCRGGDLSAEVSVELSGKILNILKGEITLLKKTYFLCNWYLCSDQAHSDHKFGLSKCPDIRYRVVFFVKDTRGFPVTGTEISVKKLTDGTVQKCKTNNKGQAGMYLPNAKYEAELKYDDGTTELKQFNVEFHARSILFYKGINAPNIKKIDGGDRFSAILTKDGKLYVWGLNDCGQLGDGTTNNSMQPQLVEGIGAVKDVSVGMKHIAAVNTEGELYVWGDNSYGQLGDGTTDNCLVPKKIESLPEVKTVALGGFHTGVVTKSGDLYMWGCNSYGQIGDGSGDNVLKPVHIKLDDKVKLVALGNNHSGAVTTMGKLYTWGYNSEYQLGTGTTSNAAEPVFITEDNIVNLSMGSSQSAYVTDKGELYTWGYGDGSSGSCANLFTNSKKDTKVRKPYKHPYLLNVKAVYCKNNITVAVSNDGYIVRGGTMHNYGSGVAGWVVGPCNGWGSGNSREAEIAGLGWNHYYYVSPDAIYVCGDNSCGQYGNHAEADASYVLFGESETDTSLERSNLGLDVSEAAGIDLPFTEDGIDLNLNMIESERIIESEKALVSVEFIDLEQNAQYNLYALKENSVEDAFKDDNLLYIDQLYANESGIISTNIMMKEGYSSACVFVVGTKKSSIADAEIVVPDCIYTGSELFCAPEVTYGGKKLKEGRDYILCDHFYGTETGTYSVLIQGIGSFEGEKSVAWRIVTGKSCLSAKKIKTAYECGEELNIDDLTVTYYDGDGAETVVTDYRTNATEIDMSIIGTKELIISYNELTVSVEITVTEKKVVKEQVIISATDIADSIYTGQEIAYGKNVLVTSNDGVNLTDKLVLTYRYSGTMADGSPYTDYDKTPVNAGEYNLTIAVDQDNENYTGSAKYSFAIAKAPVSIEAINIVLKLGDSLPETYEYKLEGLLNGDKLLIEPSLTCEATSMEPGVYSIMPKNADAGINYEIFYKNGWLIISMDSEVLPDDVPDDGQIPEGFWIAGLKDYTYTGKAIKPEVRVYEYNKLLEAGKDYTISYKNNIKACAVLPDDVSANTKVPCVVVKGKGSYTGTDTAAFKILPANLDDVITQDIVVAYNNKVQKKVPALTYNGKKLTNNKDFTVFYPALTQGITDALKAAGTYDVVLTAKDGGNFTGKRTVKLTITNATLMSKVTVKKIPNQSYTGDAIEPELTVTYQKMPLVKGIDYTVTFSNNTEVGTATAILTGIGDYAGTKKVTFKITGISVKNAELHGFQDKFLYDGNEQKQSSSMLVVVNDMILEEGADYEITYANNMNAGKASIIIKGKGAYTGTVKKTFKILPCSVLETMGLKDNITAKYVKGGCKPEVELVFAGKKLTEGKDYTVSYKNNKAVTTAETKNPSIVVKGKGNFTGTLTKYFTIRSKALDDTDYPVTLTIADKGFVEKTGKYISKPVLTDVDQKKLVAGKDYETAIVYTLEDGAELTNESVVYPNTNIKVKVTGKGAYTGELDGTYRITEKDFSKAKISITSQIYTGKIITLTKDDVTVKIGNDTLTYGTDYEIVEDSYTNNLKKGTAGVTIVGKGNYGGTKNVKFKITAKKFTWFWRAFGKRYNIGTIHKIVSYGAVGK